MNIKEAIDIPKTTDSSKAETTKTTTKETTTTTKKPNYGTTLVVSKHVTKVPQYTTKTVTVTDYSDFTITKTNYFKSCNLDDLLSVAKIRTKYSEPKQLTLNDFIEM